MAGATSGVHVVQLKPVSVSKNLQEGNKFVKWDDDSTVGTPVTLRVDPKGFFLYWTDQNKETKLLDISCVRDTRTGKYARVPREGKLRDSVTMGAQDTPLEDKTLTVVYGQDLVQINFINFCCNSRQIAQEWTDEVLKMAYNFLSVNASATTYVEKCYTKLILKVDKEDRIPVKDILKMFSQHKDDKKRVEKALVMCGLPAVKNDTICRENFSFTTFFAFYHHLTGRPEVERIFESMCGGKGKKGMTLDQLVDFLNKEQRDPRLNEILYPYANPARGRDIIRQYEPNKSYAQKDLMSVDGFLHYLMSDDNAIIAPEKFDLNQDMDQPLCHYFINSSHNTYLTGHQLTGKSSVELYRQCLLAGCRCVELDCWNGKTSDEEPIVTHGYTAVTNVLFQEVLEAIAESAFKTSSYPVILSFENHCSSKQQVKMAQYCRKILGNMLITEPFGASPLKPGQPLPSPNQMMRHIIIKNKKKHYRRNPQKSSMDEDEESDDSSQLSSPEPSKILTNGEEEPGGGGGEEEKALPGAEEDPVAKSVDLEDCESDSGSEDGQDLDKNEGTAGKESEAGAEMSALVNYVQPVRFHSFEYSERRKRSYEVSSFVETQATSLLKEHPVEFVNYNKWQLSRIYPKGTRVDSSNYMPQVFWNAGCQMIALNFQTLDLAMQLNLGIFEYNGRSGYLLKPDFMRRMDRRFDPFTESTVDGIIAGTVSVKIISGQCLSDRRIGSYVEVDMYGLPADTTRRKFRTKIVAVNGINPVYDEEPFVFKKVVLPELACLRIAVYEENSKFIGHRVLPVVGLRPGYRHISLRNEASQPLCLPSLFVHIMVKDYVPDRLSELADALANPIAYQSMVEKHAKQLMALTDDDDLDEGSAEKTQHENQNSLEKNKSEESVSPKLTDGKPNSANGTAHRPSVPSSTSPGAQLNRQDTSKLTQSVRSLSDDSAQDKEKVSSLLAEANIVAEPVEKIREHKVALKVLSKLERELQLLRQKHRKLMEKERESQQQREDKLSRSQEQQKSHLVKSHSKMAKKSSQADAHLLKRKSEADLHVMSAEHKAKLQDLHQVHSQTMLTIYKDQYRAELELHEKFQEPLRSAMDKAMQLSQAAQIEYLKSLHDREVSEFMRRLEAQTKEEVRNLGKKHKDKNELSRIKRELSQKLIDQAVAERQRFTMLLEKKMTELQRQHGEVRKLFEEESRKARDQFQKTYEDKCTQMTKQYECNPQMFVQRLDEENTNL